jgi:hypothetical protein
MKSDHGKAALYFATLLNTMLGLWMQSFVLLWIAGALWTVIAVDEFRKHLDESSQT